MAVQGFRVQLDGHVRRRWLRLLIAANLTLAATTALFILAWARFDTLSAASRAFTRYILVQGHLATENVVAAWYSSMLLLAVGALSMTAWAVDRRTGAGALRHGWVAFAAIFTLLSVDEIGSLHERVGMIAIWTERPLGWEFLLAIPMLLVACFMGAFAALHLQRVRRTSTLVATGSALFLLNPVLERIEMRMIRGAGREPGTWQRHLHDVLLVVEEGGLELFGILCFLCAAAVYVVKQAGEAPEWWMDSGTARRTLRRVVVLLGCGVLASGYATAALPAGDTGILVNWFPACAWMLVAAIAITAVNLERRVARLTAAIAALMSMMLGAGLYGYSEWLASRAWWFTPLTGVIAAALALEALLHPYLFRRSPTSSIASPTLRRPRPNPS